MARVLIVDDNRDLAQTIARALERIGHQVFTAYSGREALTRAREHRPDVIVLDVVLPDLDGYEVCRQLRSDPGLATVPVLFLTVKQDIDAVLQGFKAGGDDYLRKPFDLRELQARLEALLRRVVKDRAPEDRLQVGSLVLDPATREAVVEGRRVRLTPKEFELLRYLALHAGRIVSVDELLQSVWGYPPKTGDPDLVRAHIHNLRRKIEPSPSKPTFIKTIPRYGYLLSA